MFLINYSNIFKILFFVFLKQTRSYEGEVKERGANATRKRECRVLRARSSPTSAQCYNNSTGQGVRHTLDDKLFTHEIRFSRRWAVLFILFLFCLQRPRFQAPNECPNTTVLKELRAEKMSKLTLFESKERRVRGGKGGWWWWGGHMKMDWTISLLDFLTL